MKTENKKYLIALDMDGTLLNSNHEISPLTKKYLKELAKKGHKIIISSGRPIRNILSYYNDLELDTPIICYNGAYVYPGNEKDLPEYSFSFPQETIKQIISDIGYEYIENIVLETNKDIYLLKDDETLETFFTKKNMIVHLGKIEDTLNENTMTMLIKSKDNAYNNIIQNAIEKHDNIKLRFWSGKWLDISEIYYDFINKGKALKVIANYYHINPDNIIAFGDATNDIELINFAKYGFAMKNAENELKEKAKYITSFSNNEDGIMIELKKLGL